MKFLTVTMFSEGHGGYERHRRLSRALIEAGHEVIWMAPGISADIGEEFIPLIKGYGWMPGPLGWILQLRANLNHYSDRLEDVDAVFTTKEYDAFGCILSSFVRTLPHIFFLHGDTVECEKYLAKNSSRFKRRLKSRLMLSFYPWLQRKILKHFSHVVVQANFLADTLKSRHPNINCDYIVLASDCGFEWHPETPNPDHVALIKQLKNQKKFIIGVIAQVFYRAKGFDVFLNAMNRLRDVPDIHAIIVGYGDEAHLIPKNIKRLNLENQVTFLGRSPAAHNIMPLMDVIAAPTQFFDSFPTVILEAMDSACCIIGSDIEAHKAQLSHQELMFPNGNDEALADRLEKLYSNKATRQRNHELVEERKNHFKFDWDSQVVEILKSGAYAKQKK
jgi:glycosyltransferase involved in cell wall biosynthesis